MHPKLRVSAAAPVTDDATRRAFVQLCEEAHEAVWAVIRQYRPADPGLVWDEVRARAWKPFTSMHAQEQHDLAVSGLSRHNWISWLVTIATNYLIDLHRHTHGRRPRAKAATITAGAGSDAAARSASATSGAAGGAPPSAGPAALLAAQPAAGRRPPILCVSLYDDHHVAAQPAANPELFATLDEGWRLVNHLIRSLPADERDAVVALIDKIKDEDVAERWHVSTRTIRRRRAQALDRLRAYLAAEGYEQAADLRVA